MRVLGKSHEYWWIFGTDMSSYKMLLLGPYMEYQNANTAKNRYSHIYSIVIPFYSLQIEIVQKYIKRRISYLKSKIGEE